MVISFLQSVDEGIDRHWRVMLLFSKLVAFEGATKMLHIARYNAHFVVLMPL